MKDGPHIASFDDEPSSLGMKEKGATPIRFEDAAEVNTPKESHPAPRIPGAIKFDDTPPVSKPVAMPPRAPAPHPVSFDDAPVPSRPCAPTPTPTPHAPAPIQFSDVPSTVVPKVNPPSRGPAPIQFAPSSAPVMRPSSISASPHAAFENPLSDLEKRAIEIVRQTASDMFKQAPQVIEGCIRQLLPFTLTTLSNWGTTALQDNGQLVSDMAGIQRKFSGLNVNELIQQAIDSHSPNKSFFKRLTKTPPSFNNFRVRATGLKVQVDQLLPEMDALRKRAHDQSTRLPILLTAMSAAASVGADRLDPALDIAVHNRRTVLTQAVQQAQLIMPQIDEMRRQLVDQSSKIIEFITVTIPAMEMAASRD